MKKLNSAPSQITLQFMTENSVYLLISKFIFSLAQQLVRLRIFIWWPLIGRINQLLFTGVIMDAKDAAMKRTMIYLMSSLFCVFLGILYLANHIVT